MQSIHNRRFSLVIKLMLGMSAAILLCAPAATQNLPPEILVDQYLLEAEKALQSGDAQGAKTALEKAGALDIKPPPKYLFLSGKLLVETSKAEADLSKAAALLKQYVIAVGKNDFHYRDALALLSAAESGGLFEAGEEFRDCEDCPVMVVLPAGAFMMGSPASEEGRDDNEGPQHRVTIAKPFAVGKYEVTFAEWEACRRAGGCSHSPDDQGWGRGNRPVIDVGWKDVQEYVRWLSRETGKQYRMLSESEWEYAARAGTTTPFHTGDTISTDQANYDGHYYPGRNQKGVDGAQTVAVGSFPANSFGLHDMHGNVHELVKDCWHTSYAGAPGDGSDWTSSCYGAARVLRGGSSYGDSPRDLRSAHREMHNPWHEDRSIDIGFRVARTLTP